MKERPFESKATSRFGASMGRYSDPASDFEGKVSLQRVPLDGDYDAGGAYWGGGGESLYCAWDDEGHALYLRAKSTSEAKQKLPSSWKYSDKATGSKNSLYAEEMAQQYMETALWATSDESNDRGGDPLDKNFSKSDISKKTQATMLTDCQKFYQQNQAILDAGWPADQAGHEFWLDRNGSGSGFSESKYGTDESRDALSNAAGKFGEVHLYVERGKIYQDR